MDIKRLREGLKLFGSSGGRKWLWFTARRRFYSRVVSIGVRRDLRNRGLGFGHTKSCGGVRRAGGGTCGLRRSGAVR